MTTVLTLPASARDTTVSTGSKVVAVLAAVCVGLRVDVLKGITPGVIVMVVLAPLWWPQVRRSRPVQALVAATGVTLVVGFALAWWVKEERGIDWRAATSFASITALACAGLVVLLWARTQISVSAVVVSFMAGVVLYEFTVPGLWLDNPWKFGFSLPGTAIVLVALAWTAKRAGRPRPVLAVVVLLALALVGVASDYRSQAGFFVLAATLTVWQAVAIGSRRRVRAAAPALLLVTLGIAVYAIATQVFVSGALGTAIQQRSTAQIEASGNLLIGGRPEWSATLELMANRPEGYGLGVLADSRDIQFAGNGFASIHADPATGYQSYISNYMLADGFHLHSVAADLWAATGPVGLVLALVIVIVVTWGLSSSLAVGRAEPLLVYSSVVVLWDIAFSPLYGALIDVLLGLFLAVVSLEQAREVRAAPAAVPVADPPSHRAGAAPVLYGASAPSSDVNGGIRGSV